MLGDLKDRSVLDVGCGDGLSAILLAKLGAARVTGVDISPRSIEVARKRADLNGVADRVNFLCSPLETFDTAKNQFDIVFGLAILHHLIPELHSVLPRLLSYAKPGGLALFREPVNLSAALRWLRFAIPVHSAVTPGERPLEKAELEVIRHYIPDLRVRHFCLFSRLDRFALLDENYELSPLPRRVLSGSLSAADYMLFTVPWLRSLSGMAVLWGHPVTDSGS